MIGGFSVIFHGHIRATKDSNLLVPDGQEAEDAVLRFLGRVEAVRLSDGKRLARGSAAWPPADRADPRP